MASTSTKSIAARLPLDEYIRVLKNVTEAKLTVSDYIILQLDIAKRAAQAEAEKLALAQQVRQLQQHAQQQANLAHEQACRADEQWIELRREMTKLQQQADTNRQNQQEALKNGRLELDKMTKIAGDWQTHATNLQQANTGLEQTIKTYKQTLAQQRDELAQQKAKNGLLTSENQKLQQESSVVKTELAILKQQGISLWDDLATLHNDQLFGKIPDRYWVILDEFRESLEARP